MKTITLLTVLALFLVAWDAPQASVGGPITIFAVLLVAMVAVGVLEAWQKKRGALGWIVNIVVALFAGIVAANIGSTLIEMIILRVHFQGSLMSSQSPLLYLFMAGLAILTVFGSWIALQGVNRFRKSPA